MNDDIKEINIKIPGQILDYVDTKEHLLELYNYITNLQHTKEYLGEVLYEKDKELEKLKTKTKEQSLLLIDYQDMEQKLEDYKSRIEKAVEYIQNHQLVFELSSKKVISQWFDMFYKDTLNILNGKE